MKTKTGLPPRNFKHAGVVDWVRFSATPPPFIRNTKKTGRRAEGLRYERKVHLALEERFEGMYVASPWFRFQEVGGERVRWCQPDALLFDFQAGTITIIEVKLQHTADAWWQLRWLYLPVVSKAFPGTVWKYGLVEVVKWFDCATAFPERVKMKADVGAVRPGELGVHILKP